MQRLSRWNDHPITRDLASFLYGKPRRRPSASTGLTRSLRGPEPLERRCLLATFVVNQVGDAADFNLSDGIVDSDAATPGMQITLRAAIQNANLDAVVDNIDFNIAGAGVKTISPTSALPIISQPVVINGYSQTNAAANTLGVGSNATILIQLDGFSAGAAASGLRITAGGSTVRGLSITRFSFQGIDIQGPGNFSTIAGNFIGLPPAGNADQGNTINGVLIVNSAGNVIGGASPGDRNVISGNNANGVALAGTNAINNVVSGNYIGTNAAGVGAIGNSSAGISVSELTTGGGEASHTTIGGAFPGAGNLISGNLAQGVALVGPAAQFNAVQGNIIGLNAAGTAAIGNSSHGVLIAFSDSTAASNNTIGGVPDPVTSPFPRNIISGNGRAGVAMFGAGATGNKVQGNYIGTNPAGTLAFPNANDGVRLGDASLGAGPSGNTIGGALAGAGNLISGNLDNGIEIVGSTTSLNVIAGNLIGTTVTGAAPLPNEHMGVRLDGVPNTTIGGTTSGDRNVISGNGQAGVVIFGVASIGNKVQGNYIGTNLAGTAAVPNTSDGVRIGDLIAGAGPSGNFVGGTAVRAGNLISGNNDNGVEVAGAATNGNMIQGNRIGTNAGGTAGLPNHASGVYITGSASQNTVGGSIGASNRIAYNLQHGVEIGSGTRNTIRFNSIYNNVGLGIDLNSDGETLNDQDDLDAGANETQNWPEIVNYAVEEGNLRANAFFEGKNNTAYTIDFYVNDGSNVSLLGEGQTHFHSATLMTDANGYVEFTAVIPLAEPLGKFLTLTATDPNGNTSEFSHDADADGLFDSWETGQGVDGNGDNVSDYFLNNPDPLHKDVYVEVDHMGVIRPGMAGLVVSGAFDLNPLALKLLNPDGLGGITLHFEVDPHRISPQVVSDMATLRTIKLAQFGTRAERNNPNLLAAKRMTHRYAVFGPWLATHSGESWKPGHEFYVSLGPTTDEDLATTFMHELGHALGLGHGGVDEVNYKPNYHSVMNYLWQFREYAPSPIRESWVLDYSDRRFPTLNENNLVEMDGIGGHALHKTKVGPLPGMTVDEAGALDWNGDGDMGIEGDVVMTGINLNGLVAPQAGDPEGIGETMLVGHDDWVNLKLNFRHSAAYRSEYGLELLASPASVAAQAAADIPPAVRAALNDIGFTNKAARIQGLPDVYANPGDVISFTVPATDPEGNALTFSLAPGAPAGASVLPTSGQFTWATSAAADYGEFIITVHVVDAGSGRPREQRYGFVILGPSGDFDEDSDVDGADFLAWQRGLGTPQATLNIGDADNDDDVDHNDLNVWKREFGPVVLHGASVSALAALESAAGATALAATRSRHEDLVDAAMAVAFASPAEALRSSVVPRDSLLPVNVPALPSAKPHSAIPIRQTLASSRSATARHAAVTRAWSLRGEFDTSVRRAFMEL